MIYEDEKYILKEYEDFVYIVAHDLNGPLRHIREFSNLLLETLGDNLNEEQRLYKGFIDAAVVRLNGMQYDLLTLSRVVSQRREFKEISLDKTIRSLVSDISSSVEIIGELPVIKGDIQQINTLFRNLISNAMTYHKIGKEPHIVISSHIDGDFNVIDVKDNGIGIEEKFHDDIFRIFRRLHNVDEYGGGRGAGLTIAKKIAETHGGMIKVSSEIDQGATFHVYLPQI